MIDKITYTSWDGDPAIMAHYDDGRILGYVHYGKDWKDAHAADISTKAAVLDKATFAGRWPGLDLPPALIQNV